MKKAVFLSLILAFSIAGFSQRNPKSIEGAWKLVAVTQKSGGTVINRTNIEIGDQIKLWTGNHFSFTGVYKPDNVDLYGCGTYTLKGKDYTENILFHNAKSFVNTVYKATLELRGDTLYQTSPMTDDAGNALNDSFATEKYIRLD